MDFTKEKQNVKKIKKFDKNVPTLKILRLFRLFYSFTIAVPFKGNRFKKPQVYKQRINEAILALEVRVVTEDGEMLGLMSSKQALLLAQEKKLDLVEISPNATPPVCKIIDFGKFLYELKKKEQQQKKASKAHEIKGVRLSFRIGVGDLERQKNLAEKFLESHHPVRIQMVMRGREKAHKDLAFKKINAFIDSLQTFGVVDQPPTGSGFQIIAMMKPKGGK